MAIQIVRFVDTFVFSFSFRFGLFDVMVVLIQTISCISLLEKDKNEETKKGHHFVLDCF